jgi:hypothetical protein
MSTITRDFEVLKGKVLDQRINFDNMADRVIALEDNVEELIELTNKLVKLLEGYHEH